MQYLEQTHRHIHTKMSQKFTQGETKLNKFAFYLMAIFL